MEDSGREEPVILLSDHVRPQFKTDKKKIDELGWEVLLHAPYRPDKAPSGFHLFRSLKGWLKQKRYGSIDEVRTGIEEFFEFKDAESFMGEAFRIW